MIKLNSILKKCNNRKYKKGFVMYLSSLDDKEFEKIFYHYLSVINRLLNIYTEYKIKIFSKKWFNQIILQLKFRHVFLIFCKANYFLVLKIKTDVLNRNKKRDILLKKISENEDILYSISKQQIIFSEKPTIQEIIYFNGLIIDNIYLREETIKMIDEFNLIR